MAILTLLLAACLDEVKQGSKQIPEFQGDNGGIDGGPLQVFSVGGTVTGLSGNLVLQNNGGDDLELTGDGTFSFAAALAEAASRMASFAPLLAKPKPTAISALAPHTQAVKVSPNMRSAQTTLPATDT